MRQLAERGADPRQRLVPRNRQVFVRCLVVDHRVGQAAFILEVEIRPIPEFADRMRCKEFGRRPFGGCLPGDSFGAVLAELERGGMFGIGPGAARAIEPMRLVHAEETARLLHNVHLTANGVRHGFQSAPPRGSSLVFADAYDIVFAHCALHNRGDVSPKGNFGIGTMLPSEIMNVGTEHDMLN